MRRTRVYRVDDEEGVCWAVVYWLDSFDMDWYAKETWREAFDLAFKLEKERSTW